MATIAITYTALAAPANSTPLAQICSTYVPTNAAADLPAFEGTYYDTNVEGFGIGTTLEDFFKSCVAHPGVVLALKLAVENGAYEFETEDAKEVMYWEELVDAFADQGFEIVVSKN